MFLIRQPDIKNQDKQHDIGHSIHTAAELYGKFSNSSAARILHRLHRSAQIVENFLNLRAN